MSDLATLSLAFFFYDESCYSTSAPSDIAALRDGNKAVQASTADSRYWSNVGAQLDGVHTVSQIILYDTDTGSSGLSTDGYYQAVSIFTSADGQTWTLSEIINVDDTTRFNRTSGVSTFTLATPVSTQWIKAYFGDYFRTGTTLCSFTEIEIGITSAGGVSLPMFSVLGWDVEHGYGSVSIPLFTVSGAGNTGFGGNGTATLPIFTVDGVGDASIVGIGNVVVPIFSLDGTGYISAFGIGSVTVPMFTVSGAAISDADNYGAVTIPFFSVLGAGNSSHVGTGSVSVPFFSISGVGWASIGSTGAASIPMFTVTGYGNYLETGATLEYKAVVINTETMAITEYVNYPFNSMCFHKGKYYGACDTGIYLLEGIDDAGTNIDASYSTAITDFGTSNLKSIEDIIGHFNGNAMNIEVLDDRETVQASGTLLGHAPVGTHTERFKPGKGLKSKSFGLNVSNVAGQDLQPLDAEIRLVLLDKKV